MTVRIGVMVFKSVKALIATIGLSLGSAAIAEDLVRYGLTTPGSDYYYDAETIQKYSNNTVEVWIKVDASNDKTVPYRISRQKMRVNCSDGTFGFLAIYSYRADGTVMTSGETKYPEMNSIVPASTGNTLFKILCP